MARTLLRGAIPTPPHIIAAAPQLKLIRALALPPVFTMIPSHLDMWGNDQYGDCVTAEEAAAKAMASTANGGGPEIFIPSAEVVAWAQRNGYRDGANLTDVMDSMQQGGLKADDGQTYPDGKYAAVDFKDDALLSAAILQGPVKIAVAADQLHTGQNNGWIGEDYQEDQRIDHCVNLCGFGSMTDLAKVFGVSPQGDPNGRCYCLYTWSHIGIVDRQSMINICAEAWLRAFVVPNVNPPGPTPTPTPAPTGDWGNDFFV